jgi:hypothetical protein
MNTDNASDWGRPFHAIDGLRGGKHSDNVRHAIARVAFMNELQQHPDVAQVFERWVVRTRLKKVCEDRARSLEAIASVLGLAHRGKLVNLELEIEKLPVATLEQLFLRRADVIDCRRGELPRLLSKSERAEKALIRTLARATNGKLTAELNGLVRRLLKPGWPWVSYELCDVFLRKVLMHGLGVVHTRVLQAVDRAPKVRHIFEVKPEESRHEAVERLHGEFMEVARELLAAAEMRGRLPRRKINSVERNARWFYKSRVLDESVSGIAKEYHAHHSAHTFGPAHDDRQLVRAGILEAERLLSLTTYTWKK